ncbi:MAG: hypothetical protein AB1631_21285 [Acidobacteriota bacterium]
MEMKSSSLKKDWTLTQEAFDLLLSALDRDREQAAEKYENIRLKLTKFFRWRGCLSPEEYTDRTIDRVARRLAEGARLRAADPYLYFHGIALNILREHWREPEREAGAFDDLVGSQIPSHDPHLVSEFQEEQEVKEQRLECLDRCMERLPRQSLDLLAKYHDAGAGMNKDCRRELAAEMGIPMNALRIRAHRIRVDLGKCMTECLSRSKEE